MSYSKNSQAKYQKNGKRQFTLNLAISTNKDVIDKLDSVPSKSAYICDLIRKDINKKE